MNIDSSYFFLASCVLEMRILTFGFCAILQGFCSYVKEHVALYVDPNCEGFADEEEFVALCSNIAFPGVIESTTTASPIIFQTVAGPPPELTELLPYMWAGDGIERQYGRWTEELVIVSSLLQYGPKSVEFLFSEVKKRVSNSEWTLEKVAQKIRFLAAFLVVPTWLHDLIGNHFRKGTLSVRQRAFSEELMRNTARFGIPEMLFEIAQDWMDYCYRYPRGAHHPCMEVTVLKHGREATGWALTAPQIALYLRTLEQRALLATENVLGKRTGSKPTLTIANKAARGSQSARYHILNRLIETPDVSDEINMGMVNIALPSGDSISLALYQAIKDEILKPTRQSPAFHHTLLSRDPSSPVGPGRDETVWYKFCIEPLRACEGIKKRGRPCFFDQEYYRLSGRALIRYLKDELRLEANTL